MADATLGILLSLGVMRANPPATGRPGANLFPGIIFDVDGNPLFIQAPNGVQTAFGGGGGGVTAFSQLSDRVSANIANINDSIRTALATLTSGLGLKAPLDSPSFQNIPTAPTAAPGTNTFQLANTAFVQAAVALAVTGLLELKGNIDASANPNYPAGQVGDLYYVTVAGKVGGASGVAVDIGDAVVCKTDNAGGNQATVGASWFILEHNVTGTLLAANNLSDLPNTATAWTNLGAPAKVLAQLLTGFAAGGTGTVLATDSILVALQKLQAVKQALLQPEGSVASGGTTDVGGVASLYVNVTGAGTINSLGTAPAGTIRNLRYSGINTITRDATALETPTTANLTTAAGDMHIAISLGSGNWRILGVIPAVITGGGGGPVLTQALTGFVAGGLAPITASDTVLTAFQKLEYNKVLATIDAPISGNTNLSAANFGQRLMVSATATLTLPAGIVPDTPRPAPLIRAVRAVGAGVLTWAVSGGASIIDPFNLELNSCPEGGTTAIEWQHDDVWALIA